MLVTLDVPPTVRCLKAASMGLVALNRAVRRGNPLPPLYQSGVRYRMEGIGQERWRRMDEVYRMRWGDCEDLMGWRVAELQLRGEAAMPHIIRTGFRRFHAQVRRGDGSIEDPSRILGMRGGR